MKLTIYLDILFVTNFIINYFILKTTSLGCCFNASTLRMVLSSVFGALFSIIILFDLPVIVSMLLKVLSVLVCVAVAFGIRLKAFVYLVATTFLFTGFIAAIFQNSNVVFVKNMQIYLNINPMLLVIAIIVVYATASLSEFIFETSKKEYIYTVEINYCGKAVKGVAFYDTGFKVKDIVTFKTVMLCSFDFISDILDRQIKEDISIFYNTGTYKEKGITPVFYSDLNGNGMLPGIRPNKVILSATRYTKTLDNVLLAVSSNKISEDCDVIFGKNINNMVGGTNE